MRIAADAERRRKEEEASLKRQRISDDSSNYGYGYAGPSATAGPSTFPALPQPQEIFNAAKRRRLQDGNEATATPPPAANQAVTLAGLADFDVRSLKPELVLELIIANLQVMMPEKVQSAVEVSKILVFSKMSLLGFTTDFVFLSCSRLGPILRTVRTLSHELWKQHVDGHKRKTRKWLS